MILMNHFTAEPKKLRHAMLTAIERVMNSGWYILGQEVKNFEQLWAAECGVQFGVGVGNGLQAIEIALHTLNIGPGDEVITTPMTAFATILAILKTGATPVLADIEPNTALLSLASAQRARSPRTKAVLLVHLYGQLDNMNNWVDWCQANHLVLIEDCAQAHGAKWQGGMAGSFGQVGAFSFYPTKNLGALGDAGMLITNNPNVASKASRLRNYGERIRGEHMELKSTNSRLDEMQAALLAVRLQWLTPFTRARQQVAQRYHQEIHHPLITPLPAPTDPYAHVYHLFVINCPERTRLQAHLKNCGVQTSIHYPISVHHQPPCAHLARDPEGLNHSERHANTCLSLPCHPQMNTNEVNAVITAINSFDC